MTSVDEQKLVSLIEQLLDRKLTEFADSPKGSMSSVENTLAYLQDKWIEHDKDIWELKRKT